MIAVALCVMLAVTMPGPQKEEPAGPDPLTNASVEFARMHSADAGAPEHFERGELHVDRVQELFHRAEAFGFSGGLLFARGGKVVAAHGYGLADHVRGVPIGPDTVFDIGSVAKQFTAAGILRLEEMGLLRVDDPIAQYLLDVPADKARTTIHQLLTHSAGFPPDVGDPATLPSRDEAVRQVLMTTLRSPPGKEYAYSNVGYVLLAAIVERVSKQGFESFLRSEFWTPLGMSRTGMTLDHSVMPVAEGWTFSGPRAGRRPEFVGEDGPSWLVRGCGYVESTLDDMHRWTEALRAGRILSRASREKLFRPYVRESGPQCSYYGYGWSIAGAPDGTCAVTHDGSSSIHHDFVAFLPAHDAVLIAFNTQRNTPWRDFLERVMPVLFGATDIDLPAVAPTAAEPLDAYAGEYRLASGASVRVMMQSGRLTVPASSAEVLRLFSPWPVATGPEVDALGDRAALVASVVGAIARGDAAEAFARLPPNVLRSKEESFWKEYWPRWIGDMGAYRGAELIGTVRVKDSLRTLAMIRFERSSTVVGFVHSDGGSFFVDTMARRFVRSLTLAPRGGGEFMTLHPETGRSIKVTFAGPADGRTLTIAASDEAVGVLGMRLPR